MLENEEDFKSAKPKLQEVLEKRGAKFIMGVKFHPEFMPIERYYGYCFDKIFVF